MRPDVAPPSRAVDSLPTAVVRQVCKPDRQSRPIGTAREPQSRVMLAGVGPATSPPLPPHLQATPPVRTDSDSKCPKCGPWDHHPLDDLRLAPPFWGSSSPTAPRAWNVPIR